MTNEKESEKTTNLAVASSTSGSIFNSSGNFYMPSSTDQMNQKIGLFPDKLIIPREYHNVISMCYEFYQRGGVIGTVVNRLAELSITQIINGQRKTTDEGNSFFNAILHRQPSRLNRLIHTSALEYFLFGMVLRRGVWVVIS